MINRLPRCVLPAEFADKLCKNKFVYAMHVHRAIRE